MKDDLPCSWQTVPSSFPPGTLEVGCTPFPTNLVMFLHGGMRAWGSLKPSHVSYIWFGESEVIQATAGARSWGQGTAPRCDCLATWATVE